MLESSLVGPFNVGHEEREAPDFIIFHSANANAPTRAQGRRVLKQIRAAGSTRICRRFRPDMIGRIFREDLYREAMKDAGLREEPEVSAPTPSADRHVPELVDDATSLTCTEAASLARRLIHLPLAG